LLAKNTKREFAMHKDFLTLENWESASIKELLTLAADIKANPKKFKKTLKRQTLGMVFMKSSTRTRISFEVGMYQLGGQAFFYSPDHLQLGRGEPIKDTARVMSRYLEGVMIRAFDHQMVVDFAEYASIPVINGLTDYNHPCQVLSDFLTIQELKGTCEGQTLTYIGDGNNMVHSLLLGAPKVGLNIRIAHPAGFAPDAGVVERAKAAASAAGTEMTMHQDPKEAVAGSDIVYTDVWASMGQEEEEAERRARFSGFTVDDAMMAAAKSDAHFLHCLPAHRGDEVTDSVMESPKSEVWRQAENRLHAQKAVMATLMGRKKD
jgi:ornithine carbamoyltransferase